jgi:hypothetical protein
VLKGVRPSSRNAPERAKKGQPWVHLIIRPDERRKGNQRMG